MKRFTTFGKKCTEGNHLYKRKRRALEVKDALKVRRILIVEKKNNSGYVFL